MPEPASRQPEVSDDDLIVRARAGEQAAVGLLLRRYQHRLFSVCRRMLGTSPRATEHAADLTQEAMLKIIQGLPSFDAQSQFSTWAIRITMNTVLTSLRSEKYRQHAPLNAQEGVGAGSFGLHTDGGGHGELSGPSRVEHDDERLAVGRALACLEPEQRALLVLRDIQGLDYEQIAEALGVPVGTVKSRLFRARLALREKLEQGGLTGS